MALEHGFRRIVITLSATVFVLGVAFDIIVLPTRPVTAILVTLADGRRVPLSDVPRDAVPAQGEQTLIDKFAEKRATNKKAFKLEVLDHNARQAVDHYSNLADRIRDIPGFDTTGPPEPGDPPSFEPFLVHWGTIRQVEILQAGPGRVSWWWAHAYLTPWAATLAVLLWATFYLLRWIVRGFRDQ
jgi:hypothetical protein